MKLEVGMYVRTNNGIIEKLTNKTMLNGKYGHYFTRNDRDECYAEEEIVKSSFNLIYLIEVGDYVNGYKVISKPFYDSGYITFGLSNNTNFDSLCEIKSIITHEQYEANCYKVGE